MALAANTGLRIGSYQPGALGRIIELHGAYYGERFGFGLNYEAEVALGLAEFLHRLDPSRDGLWTATVAGQVAGAIAVDGAVAGADGARIRWFVVDPARRGRGIGKLLLREAIGFCRQRRAPRVYLWTIAGLDTATHLFKAFGFRLVRGHDYDGWGESVTLQLYELSLIGGQRPRLGMVRSG